MNITDSAIARAFAEVTKAGERRELTDSKEPGLRLRMTPPSARNSDGMKAWVLCCRDRLGAMRRFPLGDYPAMGLSDARSAARALRVQVRDQGADPIAERRRDRAIGKAARGGEGTLRAVLEIYEAQVGKAQKSWDHSRKRVDRVFAPLLDKPVAKLSPRDMQAEADAYPAQQSAAFAVRTVRPALKWLAYRGHVPVGLAELRQPVTVQRRDRVLSRPELGAVVVALKALDTEHAKLMRVLLWTGARLNEAANMTWGDVDLTGAAWTIRETKNGQPHVVPLPRQAAAFLAGIRPKDAAPTRRVFCTSSGKALGNWDRETRRVQEASGIGGWHRHDLRRTAATLTAELGVVPDIIEAMLNHMAIRSSLAATYNRSRYRPQVADALQRLADDLDAIEAEAETKKAA